MKSEVMREMLENSSKEMVSALANISCSLDGFIEEVNDVLEEWSDDECRVKLYQFIASITEIKMRIEVEKAKREAILYIAEKMEQEECCCGKCRIESKQE